MIRGLIGRVLVSVALAAGVAACAGLMSGCSSQVDTSASPPPMSASSKARVAASGPAISASLTFDQLALETPARRVTNKNGLVFRHFSYADRDGSIYKCELPEAMTKGSYPYEEWIRTFSVYKLPEAIAKKKVITKRGPQSVGDFPFVAPRPQKAQTPNQPQPQPQAAPAGMPTLPAMPAAPAPNNAMPGRPNYGRG